MSSAPNISSEALLREFVERRYHVRVASLLRLDKGVFNANLHDGRSWVVRVFPTGRTLEQVEGDAAVLHLLEQHRFPSERCIDDRPASFVRNCAFLVTEFIEGVTPSPDTRTLTTFGEMLGRLHTLPIEDGPVTREAGALHHYVRSGGGPQHELQAAADWLSEIEAQVQPQHRARFDALRQQAASADTCQHLPQAIIHPDPVLKNLLVSSGDLMLIDWTGAGRGPRLFSLAVAIWSCALQAGNWSPERIQAFIAGYRSHIQLEEEELARLPGVMRVRPLAFACWRYRHALLGNRQPDGSEWWWPSDDLAQAIADSALAAFQV